MITSRRCKKSLLTWVVAKERKVLARPDQIYLKIMKSLGFNLLDVEHTNSSQLITLPMLLDNNQAWEDLRHLG